MLILKTQYIFEFSGLFHCSVIKVLRCRFCSVFLCFTASARYILSDGGTFVNTFFKLFCFAVLSLPRQQDIYYQTATLLSTLFFIFFEFFSAFVLTHENSAFFHKIFFHFTQIVPSFSKYLYKKVASIVQLNSFQQTCQRCRRFLIGVFH